MQRLTKRGEKMQKSCRSKGVPWRLACNRILEDVSSVFLFRFGSWSWSQQALQKKKLGDKHDESLIQILFKRKGNVCQLLYENIKPSSNKLKKNKSYLSKWASLPRVFGRVSDGYVTKGLMRFGNHCGMFCFSEKYMLVGK